MSLLGYLLNIQFNPCNSSTAFRLSLFPWSGLQFPDLHTRHSNGDGSPHSAGIRIKGG